MRHFFSKLRRKSAAPTLQRESAAQQSRLRRPEITILVIGPPESGKTTIIKWIEHFSKGSLSPAELDTYKSTIYDKIVSSIRHISQALIQHGQWDQETERSAMLLVGMPATRPDPVKLQPDTAAAIQVVWKHHWVRSKFRSPLQWAEADDSARRFFDDISRVSAEDYTPTDEDIMGLRPKPTSPNTTVNVHGQTVHLIEIVMSEWWENIHSADGAIFIASMPDYLTKETSESAQQQLTATEDTFQELRQCSEFANKPIMLLLSKADILKKEVLHSSMSQRFQDYSGEGDYKSAAVYIRKRFTGTEDDKCTGAMTFFSASTSRDCMALLYGSMFDGIFMYKQPHPHIKYL